MNLKHLGFGDLLEEDEKVFAVFRHPLGSTFVKMIFFAGIWASVAWIVHFYWANYMYDYSRDNQYNFLWLIPAIYGAVKVFDVFMRWYANALLMTNESLVFAEFRHIFDRSSSRIDYFDLDDVELEKKGMSDYLRNCGDLIFAKVAGGSKEFKRVGNPRKIIRRIRKHKAKMLDEKNFTEEGALKDLLAQLVQTHVRREGQPHPEREKFREKKEIINEEENSRDFETVKNSAEVLVAQEVIDSFSESDFIRMKKEEIEKLRMKDNSSEEFIEIDEGVEENPAKSGFSIHNLKNFAKKVAPHHFLNELNTAENIEYEEHIEVEKELDDNGGLEIDLD